VYLPSAPSQLGRALPPRTNSATVAARALRRSMSPPEVALWQRLRERPAGLKFRRQHPAGAYVLDFYCAAARLCVEVDGGAHLMGANPGRDLRRDALLAEHGITTLRVPAVEVLGRMDAVVRMVVATAAERIPLQHPAGGPPPHPMDGEER
jgi:very-short-patch-repair endonuclease